jgi:hypothetical protein
MGHKLALTVLPERFAICRLEPDAPIPAWARPGSFLSITRTEQELSIVCTEDQPVADERCEHGWRCLRIRGPFAFSEVGVLSSVVGPLGAEGVSVFVVCTFDTDYVLVKEEQLERAVTVLAEAGHSVGRKPP